MNATVNILELASELAHKELIEKWDYRDKEIEIEQDGVINYSEEAQDIFNRLYDEYYTIIEQCARL